MSKSIKRFALRQLRYQNNSILNICDLELAGKVIKEGELTINLSKEFFLEEIIDYDHAKTLLISCSISNLVGKDIVNLALELKLAKDISVRLIDGIPFLMIFKFHHNY